MLKCSDKLGGGGSKKKYSDMWMLSLAKLRFISMLMTVVRLLYIDLYGIMTLHTAINNTLSLTMTYYSSITYDNSNYCA